MSDIFLGGGTQFTEELLPCWYSHEPPGPLVRICYGFFLASRCFTRAAQWVMWHEHLWLRWHWGIFSPSHCSAPRGDSHSHTHGPKELMLAVVFLSPPRPDTSNLYLSSPVCVCVCCDRSVYVCLFLLWSVKVRKRAIKHRGCCFHGSLTLKENSTITFNKRALSHLHNRVGALFSVIYTWGGIRRWGLGLFGSQPTVL